MVKLSGQGFADLQDLHTSHRIFIDPPLRVSGSISMSYISVLQATKLPEPRPLLLDLTASQEEPRSTQTLSVSQLCFHGSATLPRMKLQSCICENVLLNVSSHPGYDAILKLLILAQYSNIVTLAVAKCEVSAFDYSPTPFIPSCATAR